jgi:hypothetical protein
LLRGRAVASGRGRSHGLEQTREYRRRWS